MADGRTLILPTAVHPEAVNFVVTLPGLGRTARPGEVVTQPGPGPGNATRVSRSCAVRAERPRCSK